MTQQPPDEAGRRPRPRAVGTDPDALGGRVRLLDPSVADRRGGAAAPAPTLYVADRLLVHGPVADRDTTVAAVGAAAERLGWRVVVEEEDLADAELLRRADPHAGSPNGEAPDLPSAAGAERAVRRTK